MREFLSKFLVFFLMVSNAYASKPTTVFRSPNENPGGFFAHLAAYSNLKSAEKSLWDRTPRAQSHRPPANCI